jgi:integrase
LLDPEQAAAERWPAERLRSYLASMRARGLSAATICNDLKSLERALAVIERGADLSHLQNAVKRLSGVADQQRKRGRLQEPSRLLALGRQLMAEAAKGLRQHPRMDAALFRDGLQLALLALRPLRKRNFAALQIGKHLVREGVDWRLVIDRSETKTKQPIDVPFPDDLVPELHAYLERYRPLLAGERYTGDRLWVSYRFTPQAAHSIQLKIVEHTEKAFGISVNPHLFRDCAATSIVINDPDNVRMAAAILGHRSFATTERHYNMARSMQAGHAFHHVLKERRRKVRRGQ